MRLSTTLTTLTLAAGLACASCSGDPSCADSGICVAVGTNGGDGDSSATSSVSASTTSSVSGSATAGGGGGGGVGGEGPVQPTIAGTVAMYDGATSALVVLNEDFAHPVTTNAAGEFEFEGVTLPYNLTASSTSLGRSQVVTLRGLTTLSPRVPMHPILMETRSSFVRGAVSGPTFPLTATQSIIASGCRQPSSMFVAADQRFSTRLSWFGPATRDCDLVGMLRDGSKIIMAGKVPITLQDKHQTDLVDLHIDQPITNTTTTVELDVGAYGVDVGVYLSMATVLGSQVGFFGDVAVSNPVDVPIEGGIISVLANDPEANSVTRSLPAVLDGTTTIALPSAVVLRASEPLLAATGVSTTPTFSWTAVPDAKNYLLYIHGNTYSYRIVLPAGTTTFTFDGYATLGAGLAANTEYKWFVYAVDTDVFAPDRIVDGSGDNGFSSSGEVDAGSTYTTAPRTFTTEQ